ncbi:hypothetical protein D3C80_392310 [compost metagenome]
MLATIGEGDSNLFAILLDALCSFPELGNTVGQLASEGVEKVGTVHRRLPYTFGNAATEVFGITPIAPFEPDVLPRGRVAVGDLAVRFGDTETRDSTHGVGAKGHAGAYFTESGSGFEQLHIQMSMTAQVQCQSHASDTTTDNRNVQSRSRILHSKVPLGLIVIGVTGSLPLHRH